MWFTEYNDRIGRITHAGVISEFSAGITAGSNPHGITAGPDGNLWFTELNGIGRAALAPVVTTAAPRFGPTTGGIVVTLTGTGFVAPAAVAFDGIPGTNVTVLSATQITVTTPAHPATGAVDIVVTVPGGGAGTLIRGYTFGIPNALPTPRAGSGSGNPAPLPGGRSGGGGQGQPNPLPIARP
jgi:hypothetical protein